MVAAAQGADVDDHVNLAGATADRVLGLLHLRGSRIRAERKATDRADGRFGAGELGCGERDPERVDADAREAILAGLPAQSDDLLASGVRFQNGVIDQAREPACIRKQR